MYFRSGSARGTPQPSLKRRGSRRTLCLPAWSARRSMIDAERNIGARPAGARPHRDPVPADRVRRQACPCPAKLARAVVTPIAARNCSRPASGDGAIDLQAFHFRLSDKHTRRPPECSPCCTRACVMSMRPPAACISRKRTDQGFEKSFKPRSMLVTVGIHWFCSGRDAGPVRMPESSCSADLDHRSCWRRTLLPTGRESQYASRAKRFACCPPLHCGRLPAASSTNDARLGAAGVPHTYDWQPTSSLR